MPTYSYICEECNKEIEVFQRITAEPLSTCQNCGGRLRKKISGGAGLVFKGSGFYITDYKNKKTPSAEKVKKDKTVKKEKKAS